MSSSQAVLDVARGLSPYPNRLNWLRWSLMLLPAFVATIFLYGPTINFGFVSDDFYYLHRTHPYLSLNPFLFFLPLFQKLILPPFYRPTSIVPFIWDQTLFGGRPQALHLLTLALRILMLPGAGLLLYAAFRDLTEKMSDVKLGRALCLSSTTMATLLFATSPWGIESATWLAALPDALILVSFIYSVLAFRYLCDEERRLMTGTTFRAWVAAWLCVVSGAAAYASKEPALLLPFVFACLLNWRQKKRGLALWLIILFFAFDTTYCIFRFVQLHTDTDGAAWAAMYVDRSSSLVSRAHGIFELLFRAPGRLIVGPGAVRWLPVFGSLAFFCSAVGLTFKAPPVNLRWSAISLVLIYFSLIMHGGLTQPRYGYLPYLGCLIIVFGALIRVGEHAARTPLRSNGVFLGFFVIAGLNYCLTQSGLGAWRKSGTYCQDLRVFLSSRPADEETVLLWIPQAVDNVFLGFWSERSYCVSDSHVPSWMKSLSGAGECAYPLAFLESTFEQLPKYTQDGDSVTLHCPEGFKGNACHPFDFVGKLPDLQQFGKAEFLCEGSVTQVTFHLRRAPKRRFFILSESGWRELL